MVLMLSLGMYPHGPYVREGPVAYVLFLRIDTLTELSIAAI